MDDIYKALSDPTRRRILALLREQDMTAGELAAHFDLAKPTLSRHFSILKQTDLIHADKKGVTITYHLNLSALEDALLFMMTTFKLPVGSALLKPKNSDVEGTGNEA